MPRPPLEILCIGHAAVDLSVLVDEYPAENSKCEVRELVETGGGPAANAACLLASWGVDCGFAGVIGADDAGRRVLRDLEASGVDGSLLQQRHGHATPVSLILVNRRSGSRTIVTRKVPTQALQLEPSALGELAPRLLLFDGHEPEASLAAAQACRGAMTLLDAGSWREGTASLAGQVDYLVASERFALKATGLPHLDGERDWSLAIGRLRDRFETATAVTLGERGVIGDEGGGFRHLPAFPARVVDTTGAGDIFHGAFAYCLHQGVPFWEGLRFAAMAASLSVGVAGGRTSIPALARVKEALAHAG